ncbi:hypothetical protein FR483_N168R [Paramecium bursaria Chlorella virus FR483]|uniref:Uncharacterized protein N168R n=1 Tax=Paramecium bursaria Chlorella virus FR483 TaxID=399781 RepID=A7J6M2_PBCVF|nr:hypothetical protein FR483_N168R [Paramecium bursaria Chlorella virus FR483]ABT15453.1 hypothetical protein FR483_N168R [Paramecium bursaria Chlorella virus FR483]
MSKKILPLSGSEENFTDFVYGSSRWGKKNNNCYAFALDWFRAGGQNKLQPGQLSKTLKSDDDLTDPKTLKARVIADLATKKDGGYISSPCVKCKEGYYKVMAVVDKGVDYHWYRQMGDMVIDTNGKNTNTLARNMGIDKSQIDIPTNSNKALIKKGGLFAHKRGLADLTVLDASGKFITDPRTANRNYGDTNYSTYVATYCINKNFGKGGNFSCTNKKNA